MGSLGISVSSAPSFDITSLDTKDFTEGLWRRLIRRRCGSFLNEGIDYRLVLMLLASGIRQVGSNEMLLNAPDSSRIVCYTSKPGINALPNPKEYRILEADRICTGYKEREFYSFLRVLNNTGRLYAINVRPSPRPVGIPFAINMNKDLSSIASLNPSDYFLQPISSGEFQLMSLAPYTVTVLCSESLTGPKVVSVLSTTGNESETIPADSCNPNEATISTMITAQMDSLDRNLW